MEFKTRSVYPKTIVSDSGSHSLPIHIKAIDVDGFPYLAEVGSKNLYDVIQSHKDECDIRTIVAKYEAGDKTVLGKLQGFYADLTGSPSSLQDALNAMNKVKAQYNRLPSDVRMKMSLSQFVSALGTDSLKDILSPAKDDKPADTNIEKEVNVDA